MSESIPASSTPKPPAIVRGGGVTSSERYLQELCDKSFLSLWSYPCVFRDQGRKQGKGDGKEVCDVLVVFENHVIIFSDKHCMFGNTGIQLDWSRWFKKTVRKSAEQVWGAERWIRSFPSRLFLDRGCETPLSLALPATDETIFHRIVVAHDGSRRCREHFGGSSGSLMLDSTLCGDSHLQSPFMIGRIDASQEYVHVFDDTTLDIVLKTLDTISDFVAYLSKKEQLLTGDKRVLVAGEEELLAAYLVNADSSGRHDFGFPRKFTGIFFGGRLLETLFGKSDMQSSSCCQ